MMEIEITQRFILVVETSFGLGLLMLLIHLNLKAIQTTLDLKLFSDTIFKGFNRLRRSGNRVMTIQWRFGKQLRLATHVLANIFCHTLDIILIIIHIK